VVTDEQVRLFINGNAISAPYNAATWNAQNRYINVMPCDALGVNCSTHVNDAGFVSRQLPVQDLSLRTGIPAPSPITGKVTLFVDAADGAVKALLPNGKIKVLAVQG
jgi:hypothetical protein